MFLSVSVLFLLNPIENADRRKSIPPATEIITSGKKGGNAQTAQSRNLIFVYFMQSLCLPGRITPNHTFSLMRDAGFPLRYASTVSLATISTPQPAMFFTITS